jgi:hypothetical protein
VGVPQVSELSLYQVAQKVPAVPMAYLQLSKAELNLCSLGSHWQGVPLGPQSGFPAPH